MTEQIKGSFKEEMNALEHELVRDFLRKSRRPPASLAVARTPVKYPMDETASEVVKARLRQLGARMADLALINMDNIPKDRVGLGSTVKVFDNTKNAEVEYKLVTSRKIGCGGR